MECDVELICGFINNITKTTKITKEFRIQQDLKESSDNQKFANSKYMQQLLYVIQWYH